MLFFSFLLERLSAAASGLQYFYSSNYMFAYTLGIFVGYFIVNNYAIKAKLHHLSISAFLLTVFTAAQYGYAILRANQDATEFMKAAFNFGVNIGYTLCFAWIFFACATKCGGIVNWVFANRLVALGRISFSSYMMHYLIIWYIMFNNRHFEQLNTLSLHTQNIALMVYTNIAGFFFHLVFEAPSISISSSLKKKSKEEKEQKELKEQAENNNSKLKVG